MNWTHSRARYWCNWFSDAPLGCDAILLFLRRSFLNKKVFFIFTNWDRFWLALADTTPKFKPVYATDVIALQVELETWRTDCPFPSIWRFPSLFLLILSQFTSNFSHSHALKKGLPYIYNICKFGVYFIPSPLSSEFYMLFVYKFGYFYDPRSPSVRT